MKATQIRRLAVQAGLAGLLCGTSFQLGGCLSAVAQNFNPCGTIINCDPTEFDLLFTDVPDFEYNPTCTIPGIICSGSAGTTGSRGGGAGGGGFGNSGFGF